jgi:nitric oxide reductase large subunit
VILLPISKKIRNHELFNCIIVHGLWRKKMIETIWILFGLIAAGFFLYFELDEQEKITLKSIFIAFIMIFTGPILLIIALLVSLITLIEDSGNITIYEKGKKKNE